MVCPAGCFVDKLGEFERPPAIAQIVLRGSSEQVGQDHSRLPFLWVSRVALFQNIQRLLVTFLPE